MSINISLQMFVFEANEIEDVDVSNALVVSVLSVVSSVVSLAVVVKSLQTSLHNL